MRWAIVGDPAGSWEEAPVRCVTTGRDGWARLAWDGIGYRIDGPVRAILVDSGGGRWRVVIDRSPVTAQPAELHVSTLAGVG